MAFRINQPIKNKTELIELLHEKYHILQIDLITSIWQVKNTMTGMAKLVDKSIAVALLRSNAIEKITCEGQQTSNYNFYALKILKQNDGSIP